MYRGCVYTRKSNSDAHICGRGTSQQSQRSTVKAFSQMLLSLANEKYKSFIQQSQPSDFRDTEVSYNLDQTILSLVQTQSRPYSRVLSSRKQPSPQSHDLWMLFHRKPSNAEQRPVYFRLGKIPALCKLPPQASLSSMGEWRACSEKQQPQMQLQATTKVDSRRGTPFQDRGTTHRSLRLIANSRILLGMNNNLFSFQSVSFTRLQSLISMSSCSTQAPKMTFELEQNARLLAGAPPTQNL